MESVLLGIGIVILCYLAVKAPKLLQSKTPTVTGKAQVVSRRGNLSDTSYSNFRGSPMQYFVTFRIGEENLELGTTAGQYARLVEGTQGTLTYRDRILLSFEPENE